MIGGDIWGKLSESKHHDVWKDLNGHLPEGIEESKSDVSTEIMTEMDMDEEFEDTAKPSKRSRAEDPKNDADLYKLMELPPGEKPQPFTCICYSEKDEKEHNFYTTDQSGFFLHKNKYMRCIADENHDIHFKFIRELDLAEICALQSLDCGELNVIENLSGGRNNSFLH